MKKFFIIMLVLIMTAAQAGIAEENMDHRVMGSVARVFGTEGEIAITVEPGAGDEVCMIPERADVVVIGEMASGYSYVYYDGSYGYMPWEYLDMSGGIGGLSIMRQLTGEQAQALNAFITKCTRSLAPEEGALVFSADAASQEQLLDFAVNCVLQNFPENVEEGEFENGNTLRVSDAAILEALGEMLSVDQAEMDVALYPAWDGDACYFSQAPEKGSFAIIENVYDMENGEFEVRFSAYGKGADWTDECLAYTAEEAAASFPEGIIDGVAIITASDIAEGDSFRLSSLIIAYR